MKCDSYNLSFLYEKFSRSVGMADIVVAAGGKPNFIQGEWLKGGAVVFDAGYNNGNIGDIDYESCLEKIVSNYTRYQEE